VSQTQEVKQMSTRRGQRARTSQKNECDTAMDANWTTLNCRTNIVQTVLYSGCTEAAVPCSPYNTCIQYGSDAPTLRKKQSPNSSWRNHKRQVNKQQERQDNNAQTHQEQEGSRQL
jgi:hypothetical protein